MANKTRKSKVTLEPQESGLVFLRLGLSSLFAFLVFHIDFLALSTSTLFGVYFASKLLARTSLSGIHTNISTNQIRSQVGSPIQAYLTIANRNRYLPIFHPIISVREKGALNIHVFQFHSTISAGQSQVLSIEPTISQRGLHRLEVFSQRSLFPFSLHEASTETNSETKEIIVWPKPAAIDLGSIFNEPPLFRFNTIGEQIHNTQETEAARIRDYQPGDPKPQINWKLTAKLDKLTVIEPRDEHHERYELHLDTSTRLWTSELVFERMLRFVSTLVSDLSRRKLIQAITIDELQLPLSNNRQRTKFFDTLSTLQATRRDPEQPELKRRNHLWILPAPNAQIRLASQLTPEFREVIAQ